MPAPPELPHRAWIALGANLGNPRETLTRAIESLNKAPSRIRVERVSNWIETAPVGGPPDQPRYLNGAASLRTSLRPRELLEELLRIELELGRDRSSPERNGPRAIDLDLLLYEGEIISDSDLQVPHPRLHQRAFVLIPLAEIAPDAVHPVLKKKVRELLAEL